MGKVASSIESTNTRDDGDEPELVDPAIDKAPVYRTTSGLVIYHQTWVTAGSDQPWDVLSSVMFVHHAV